MAKRYTDTTIWKNQRWFKKLSPIHKLAWKYITDTCDHAGILKIDFSEFVDDLGLEEFDILDFIKHCNTDFDKANGKKIERERIKLLKNNIVWITGFLKFQYESKDDVKIKTLAPVVFSALTILDNYGIFKEGLDKGYYILSEPFDKGYKRKPKGSEQSDKGHDGTKDKVKDKDIIILKEGICHKMILSFKNNFPEYFSVEEIDLPSTFKIAKYIAKQNEWDESSITNGKMKDIISEWESILEFTKGHNLYSNFSIQDLEKKWTGVIQSKNSTKLKTSNISKNKNSFI